MAVIVFPRVPPILILVRGADVPQPDKVARTSSFGALGVGFALGIAIEPAGCCDLCASFPTVAFVCDPSERPLGDRCPQTHTCCSDDPATADGALPSYKRKDIDGSPPLFAEAANGVGRSGMCVRTQDVAQDGGLVDPRVQGCPIPCNPTWDEADLLAVCGAGRECCQTVALVDDDCVRDADTQLWRAADGRDAVASLDGGMRWQPTTRSSHQDPDFATCEAHAGDRGSDAFRSCVAQLTTANQRGFCMALVPDQLCPTDPEEGYRSVCNRKND